MSGRSAARSPPASVSPAGQADDLSRWVLAHPDQFEPSELRCWRIASPTWLQVAGEQLDAVDRVERPVALFVMPAARGDGWQLTPVLSLDAIRLFVSLGGQLERDLRSAVLPAAAASELIERINVHTLHAGPKECLDSAGQLAQELTRELGVAVGPGSTEGQARPVGTTAGHPPLLPRTATAPRPRARAARGHVPGAGVRAATSRFGPA